MGRNKSSRRAAAPPRIGIVSLGCPKATVDSERIIKRLLAEGYALSSSYEEADLVIVNTCGFIEEAEKESLAAIGEALAEHGRVLVTGCLGARAQRIQQIYPQVLAITGPNAPEDVIALVRRHVPLPCHEQRLESSASAPATARVQLTPRHYAYLKISEGCNHRCTFCIIPQLRGALKSRPLPEILSEAEAMLAAGVREILVVAQDTAAYGSDLNPRTAFWRGKPFKQEISQLARALGSLDRRAWVRLHYLYPYPVVDELVELMADGYLVPYLDIPLQHAASTILQRMKRPAASEKMLQRIERWRAICPELTIRSSFIVGFPGETDEEFEALLDFLTEAELDRVGVFTYSPVEGAAANAFPNPVPVSLQLERQAALMQLQEEISAKRLQRFLDRTIPVLVDEVRDDLVIGRSFADAPEIDGVVYLESHEALEAGMIVRARVTDSDAHDLYATVIEVCG